jgi:hypothetical protein
MGVASWDEGMSRKRKTMKFVEELYEVRKDEVRKDEVRKGDIQR